MFIPQSSRVSIYTLRPVVDLFPFLDSIKVASVYAIELLLVLDIRKIKLLLIGWNVELLVGWKVELLVSWWVKLLVGRYVKLLVGWCVEGIIVLLALYVWNIELLVGRGVELLLLLLLLLLIDIEGRLVDIAQHFVQEVLIANVLEANRNSIIYRWAQWGQFPALIFEFNLQQPKDFTSYIDANPSTQYYSIDASANLLVS